MYQFVVLVLYLTILGLFAVCWFTLRKWSSRLHAYLFFYSVSNLVYDVGYLLELRSKNQETYVVALKMAYLGRIWIGLALFLFAMELCSIYIPLFVKSAIAIVHAVIYITILEIGRTDLYYNYMEFVMDGDFPKLLHTGGPLYTVQSSLGIFYTVAGLFLIVRTYIREKNHIAKKRYLLILIAMVSVGVSYVVYLYKLIPLARLFDVMIIGYAICTALMLIAIIKYRMLDAKTVARNYVVDELSEGIIVVDTEDQISYYNKPARKLFPNLAKAIRTDEIIENIREAIKSGEPIMINDRIYTPKANPLLIDGVSVGTLYALADDTEQYDYMRKLREQRQIADDANKAKSQFLANMSHEIRTPINAILGMDEMILRESSEKEITEYADDIKSSGKALLTLINDILDFSKVEEGKMEIILVQYDPVMLKNDLVNMIKERAVRKHLDFTVEFDENIPRLLKGDEIRIKQCALNLLTNAVKYTNEGAISLMIGFTQEDKDHITLDFTVRDSGVGIKAEDMKDLFSPFVRIDEMNNRSIEGTGLGLTITKRLLDLMGSELKVSSEYQKGSEFSFSVRQEVLNSESVAEYTRRSDSSNGSGRRYRELFHAPDAKILVVDDIKMNLTVFTKLLKRTQMEIDTATSGPEAIKMAAEKSYDVIFVDHLMPGMDGIETLKHLKENERDSKPVYVALTANAISGARELYLDAGFADYISKPVEGGRLETLIKSYLPPEKLLDTLDGV